MWFNSIKHPNTSFVVVSPIIKDKFSEIKEVKKRLNKEGVMFRYQVLKENGRSIKYPDYMRNEISRGLVKSTNKIKDGSFFGKKCHAGHLFFIVKVNGDAFRCYETQPNSYLGNIATGTFKRNLIPLPCLSFKCTCRLPYINNIILFKEKERPLKLAHYLGRNLIKDKIFQKKLLNKSINFLR